MPLRLICLRAPAVLTSDDADADGLQPMQPVAQANTQTAEPFAFAAATLLAEERFATSANRWP